MKPITFQQVGQIEIKPRYKNEENFFMSQTSSPLLSVIKVQDYKAWQRILRRHAGEFLTGNFKSITEEDFKNNSILILSKVLNPGFGELKIDGINVQDNNLEITAYEVRNGYDIASAGFAGEAKFILKLAQVLPEKINVTYKEAHPLYHHVFFHSIAGKFKKFEFYSSQDASQVAEVVESNMKQIDSWVKDYPSIAAVRRNLPAKNWVIKQKITASEVLTFIEDLKAERALAKAGMFANKPPVAMQTSSITPKP